MAQLVPARVRFSLVHTRCLLLTLEVVEECVARRLSLSVAIAVESYTFVRLLTMSIAPGIPLKLYSSCTPGADYVTAPPVEQLAQPSVTSNIVASPTDFAAHQQSTASVLSTLHSSHPIPAPTDVEDLILFDGTARRRPPVIPAYCPYRVKLQPGRTYRWCACGRSQRQPWCDGSHQAGDPQPLVFSVSVEQRFYYLCGCKYSSKPPFCDGSHIHAVLGAEEQQQRAKLAVAQED